MLPAGRVLIGELTASAWLHASRLSSMAGKGSSSLVGGGGTLAASSTGSIYGHGPSVFLRALRSSSSTSSSAGAAAAHETLPAALAATARRKKTGPIGALISNYKQLSKFRLSALVVLTGTSGFVAGSGENIDWCALGWTSLGIFGASACANALNQTYEVINDARMTRTANRPLPTGRMGRAHALAFAVVMGSAGIALLYDKANPVAAGLGLFNIALYAGVYTPLKQMSIANTWVGALVGAVPPLIGWAAAVGGGSHGARSALESPSSSASASPSSSASWLPASTPPLGTLLGPGSMVLAGALFSWQMPHFMALAWMCKEDYIKGGFKMISGVDPTGRRTAGVALRHSLLLAPVGLLAWALGTATWPLALESAALGLGIGASAMAFASSPSASSARRMFRASLIYLPVLMVGMAVHRVPHDAATAITWGQLGGKMGLSSSTLYLYLRGQKGALPVGEGWEDLQHFRKEVEGKALVREAGKGERPEAHSPCHPRNLATADVEVGSSSHQLGGWGWRPLTAALEAVVEAVANVAGRIDSGLILSYVVKCPSRALCRDVTQPRGNQDSVVAVAATAAGKEEGEACHKREP